MAQMMSVKDPDDVLDYTIDWSTWLGGDTIVSSSWIVAAGISQVTASSSDTATTIWLAGGSLNKLYRITNQIVTASGRTKEDSIYIPMKDN